MFKPYYFQWAFLVLAVSLFSALPKFKAPEQLGSREFCTAFQFSLADLNGDAKKDLILLNGGRENMFVCWNAGTDAAPVFGHAERLWLNLTETKPLAIGDAHSLQMVDFDKDGDLDIFTWGTRAPSANGPAWVRNDGNAQLYSYDTSYYLGPREPGQWANQYKQTFAADWDKDGKMDVIVGDSSFRTLYSLTWFRDTSSTNVRAYGPRRVFRCGGYNPDTVVRECGHPFVSDWNNDGRLDILTCGSGMEWAQGDRKVRVFMGTSLLDSLAAPVVVDSVVGGTHFGVYDWNADGKKDLAVMDTLAYLRVYVNRGTDAAPAFSGRPDTVFGNDFNHSDNWFVQLLDWNNDGRKDLVYSGSFNQMCSSVWPRVRLYLNEAATGDPQWGIGRFLMYNNTDIRSNWGVAGRSWSAVNDMDNDGDWDLYLNYYYSGLQPGYYYYQGGPSTASTFNFATEEIPPYVAPVNIYKYNAYPRICDLNRDGLKDLLLGLIGVSGSSVTLPGRVYWLRNTGTATAPHFTDSNAVLMASNGNHFNGSFDVWDMDGDSLKDIIMGTDSGGARVFLNKGSATAPSFPAFETLQLQAGGPVANPAYPFHRMFSPATTVPGANILSVGDFDNDGAPDLFSNSGWVRNFFQWSGSGAFYLFRGVANTTGSGTSVSTGVGQRLIAGPNPFTSSTILQMAGIKERGLLSVRLYDIAGRVAHAATFSGAALSAGVSFSPPALPSGVYWIRVADGANLLGSVRLAVLR